MSMYMYTHSYPTTFLLLTFLVYKIRLDWLPLKHINFISRLINQTKISVIIHYLQPKRINRQNCQISYVYNIRAITVIERGVTDSQCIKIIFIHWLSLSCNYYMLCIREVHSLYFIYLFFHGSGEM